MDELCNGILTGDRKALSKAITFVESRLKRHQDLMASVIRSLLPHTGNSLRIGITGLPGAGKSTLIDTLGSHLLSKGHRLAVLAIDPSSTIHHGSILGDKTRMVNIAAHPSAFIRPSPSSGTLGGIRSTTQETLLLCEAAGFDVIFIETVGVGQSETMAADVTDLLLYLLIAGAGDELQGMKSGLLERADLIAVNKADGEARALAEKTLMEYKSAQQFRQSTEGAGPAHLMVCSATEGTGIPEMWDWMTQEVERRKTSGVLEKRRREQGLRLLDDHIRHRLAIEFYNDETVQSELKTVRSRIQSGDERAIEGAVELVRIFLHRKG